MSFLQEMTAVERLILLNQYKLLYTLAELHQTDTYYGSKQDYANAITILERGYARHYDEITGLSLQHYMDHPVQQDVPELVVDVLNMYDALQRAREGGLDTSSYWLAQFRGFDGKEESYYSGYARFLVEDLDRYRFLNINNFDAHQNTLATYEAMLNAWKASHQQYKLSEEDLQRIRIACDSGRR